MEDQDFKKPTVHFHSWLDDDRRWKSANYVKPSHGVLQHTMGAHVTTVMPSGVLKMDGSCVTALREESTETGETLDYHSCVAHCSISLHRLSLYSIRAATKSVLYEAFKYLWSSLCKITNPGHTSMMRNNNLNTCGSLVYTIPPEAQWWDYSERH